MFHFFDDILFGLSDVQEDDAKVVLIAEFNLHSPVYIVQFLELFDEGFLGDLYFFNAVCKPLFLVFFLV